MNHKKEWKTNGASTYYKFNMKPPKTRICQSCSNTYAAMLRRVRNHAKYCPKCQATMENKSLAAWKY